MKMTRLRRCGRARGFRGAVAGVGWRRKVSSRSSRRGNALIAVLVVMLVISAVLLSVIRLSLATRIQLRNEHQLRQTRWLLMAGRESIAAGRLEAGELPVQWRLPDGKLARLQRLDVSQDGQNTESAAGGQSVALEKLEATIESAGSKTTITRRSAVMRKLETTTEEMP